jgi:catechol 2,3-dioxygenase
MSLDVRFSPRRLGHLNMFVRDVEKSAAFYRDVCGFQVVFREDGISMIFMSNGNTHHDLGLMEITDATRIGRDGHVQVKPGAGKTPGLNHLGFEMETEFGLVEAYRRAKAHDLPINRTTDHQIAHSVYMPDCEGHTLEFYADVVDDWKQVYAQNEGELISGHWDVDSLAPLKTTKAPQSPDLYRNDGSVLAAQKVAYAGLPVKNFERAVEYYCDVVGLEAASVDRTNKFAVMRGTAGGGCDVCLVGAAEFPAVRMVFGGVHLHDGKPIRDSLEILERQNVYATIIGDAADECIIVLDPDGIPLVYSTSSSLDLMSRHGPSIVDEVYRITSLRKASHAA